MPGPLYTYVIQNSPALVKLHNEIVGTKNEGSVCHPSWIILHEIAIPTVFVTLKHYSEYLRKGSIFFLEEIALITSLLQEVTRFVSVAACLEEEVICHATLIKSLELKTLSTQVIRHTLGSGKYS